MFDNGKAIKYDHIFSNDNNSQEKVFEDVKKLVQSAFDGHNICICAYGQTGSGKTYTIHGNSQQPGIAPRMIQELFRLIEAEKEAYQAIIEMHMVEIYNEKIIDLLKIDKGSKQIEIKQDEDGSIYLTNCTRMRLDNCENMDEVYCLGIKNRKVRQTEKNDESSRSHFIVTIMLQMINRKTK